MSPSFLSNTDADHEFIPQQETSLEQNDWFPDIHSMHDPLSPEKYVERCVYVGAYIGAFFLFRLLFRLFVRH